MMRISRPRHRGQPLGAQAQRADVLDEILRQRPLLYRVLAGCGIPEAEREELAQDALVRAVDGLNRRSFIVPLGRTLAQAVAGWLTTLATMRACNYRTKARRPTVDIEVCDVPAPESGPEEQACSAALLGALDRLTPAEHRLLVMIGLGFTHGEIAAQTGIPARTVEGRIVRARRAFCEAVRQASFAR